ncbi:hypothetical protein RIF29_18158 [Crotalaria pallida]|uniref:Amino acid transporter transmembrane domain-containing protein n=1 Tax=Crotalaria pallida TaxID=3830 RepID=A0AAN9FJV9_CROPI
MAVQNSLQITRSGTGTYDDDGRAKRTGTLRNAVAHIITAVIGAGVLSLAWSTSQLGWIAGPLSLLFFAVVTYVSSFLLSDCYRTPDPVTGKRNYSYMDAVRIYLGNKRTWMAGSLQYLTLYGTSTAYVITTATCLRAILRSNCFHKEGHHAPCKFGDTVYMMLFGLVQVIMSFIPDLHNMAWVSVVAAIMSLTYSFIGLGLGIATVIENGRIMGSVTGVPASNLADKSWLVFQALGDIAFAYPYSVILLEIQDTLESPPSENKTMKKASMIAIFITTFFYLCCGCFGYAAFGNLTPGNLLTGFGFYEPYWLIDLANACIVLHLVGGYQIFSQPIFSAADRWCSRKYPNSGFVNNLYRLKLPLLPAFQLNLFRICFRTAYVISTTGLAILFPYFNQVLGVLGAISFWPLAIYFPVEMYFVQKKIGAWSRKWVVLRTFSFVCFIVSLMGLVGSIEGIIISHLALVLTDRVQMASDNNTPLLLHSPPPVKRTGTVWTAVAHIVTGVIGSGVLSLAWSIAQLGWVAGPFSILIIALTTLLSAFLLSNTYLSPQSHPQQLTRSSSYLDVVHFNLGIRNGRLCGLLVSLCLYGFGIAFIITSALSIKAIQNSNCHNKREEGACESAVANYYIYMLLFGVIQIVLSQIPNFHNIKWLSVVAAIMSFAYSSIGVGLSLFQTIENGHVEGSIEGISTSSATEKLWLVAQALGDISFSYPFSTILIEIQDTLKSPPPENQTMNKASTISVIITTFFYLGCACAGYAAFGNDTPGNLLTGFGSSRFYWLVDFANVCIVVHLVGAYQVYSQPLFANVENWFHFKFPNSELVNHTYILKIPMVPAFELNFLRLSFRTAYVASTTVIAMIFPYFNQILGVLGSISFWPLTIYFPVEMYLSQSSTEAWTAKWIILRTFSILGSVLGLFTLIGSIKGIPRNLIQVGQCCSCYRLDSVAEAHTVKSASPVFVAGFTLPLQTKLTFGITQKAFESCLLLE